MNNDLRPKLVSSIVSMDLTEEIHEWKGRLYRKTWIITMDSPPYCNVCNKNIQKDSLAFVLAKRVPNIIEMPKMPLMICPGCYKDEYPGRVAIVDYEEGERHA